MEQTVVVVSVDGDEALVRGQRASACGSCAGKSSCSTLGSWVERMVEMRVQNPVDARIGDTVVVAVQEGVLLRAALRLYGLPMLAFFAFGMFFLKIASMLHASAPDLWAVAGGMTGLAMAYTWVALHARSHDRIEASILSIKERAVATPVQFSH